MTRSRRQTSIVPISTSSSEKQEKRKANRALRKATRHAIAEQNDVLPLMKDVSNVAAMSKDGKVYVDPDKHPKITRK